MGDQFDAARTAESALSADPGDGALAERLAIDDRKYTLRIEAAAREELTAANMPAVPALMTGTEFLAQSDPEPPWRIAALWPAGGNIVLAAQSGLTEFVGMFGGRRRRRPRSSRCGRWKVPESCRHTLTCLHQHIHVIS